MHFNTKHSQPYSNCNLAFYISVFARTRPTRRSYCLSVIIQNLAFSPAVNYLKTAPNVSTIIMSSILKSSSSRFLCFHYQTLCFKNDFKQFSYTQINVWDGKISFHFLADQLPVMYQYKKKLHYYITSHNLKNNI
jgi:hypothetical protein